MTRNILFIFSLVYSIFFVGFSQNIPEGNWRGIIKASNQTIDDSDVFYISFKDESKGFSRIEKLNTKEYVYKEFSISTKNDKIILEERYIKASSNSKNAPKCKLNYEMSYDESSGYLTGTYKSSDCKNVMGEITLYRTNQPINSDKEPTLTHYWKYQFAISLSKGLPSPEILERERKNFEFSPIYFDHDKSEIKPEFYEYLNKLARILEGLHDLRLLVVGHTDAVGTDEYNIGLSERRAKAIKDYFLKQGIENEKLEIDFKGKRMPIDTNKTPEGKSRNRRVDFSFI